MGPRGWGVLCRRCKRGENKRIPGGVKVGQASAGPSTVDGNGGCNGRVGCSGLVMSAPSGRWVGRCRFGCWRAPALGG